MTHQVSRKILILRLSFRSFPGNVPRLAEARAAAADIFGNISLQPVV